LSSIKKKKKNNKKNFSKKIIFPEKMALFLIGFKNGFKWL